MFKGIVSPTLRATTGLINSLFALMNVPLCAPDDSCASKRSRTVKVAYRRPSKGKVTDLVIDSTGLKALGEGEWKARKHGAESGANCIWPLTRQPTIGWRRKFL
jgi:hypothetical protein